MTNTKSCGIIKGTKGGIIIHKNGRHIAICGYAIALMLCMLYSCMKSAYVADVYRQKAEDYMQQGMEWYIKNQELQSELNQEQRENEELREQLDRYLVVFDLSELPIDTSKKTFMDYRCISNKTSEQWRIQTDQRTRTDEDGLRVFSEGGEEYYCVALGSYFGKIGDKFKVVCDNGNSFNVIMSDVKSDKDTDKENKYTLFSKCCMEWIVDVSKLDFAVRIRGNVNNIHKIAGSIKNIILLAN